MMLPLHRSALCPFLDILYEIIPSLSCREVYCTLYYTELQECAGLFIKELFLLLSFGVRPNLFFLLMIIVLSFEAEMQLLPASLCMFDLVG